MKARPVEERVPLPWFAVGLAWPILVLAWFGIPSLRVLPVWGTLFKAGPVLPGAPGWAGALVHHLQVVLSTFAVLVVTWVCGRRFRTWMGRDREEAWVRISLDLLTGVFLLGTFWMGTGLCGLWFPVLGKGLGLPLLLWGLWSLFQRATGSPKLDLSLPKGPGPILLAAVSLLYLGFAFLQDLAPETFYDSMVYHLAVPARWVARHAIGDIPVNFFSNYPYGAEIFFLNGLLLQGTQTAKMLHLACLVGAGLLAGGWAREIAGGKAGWIATVMVLTLPLLSLCVWTTQVEGALGWACLASLYSAERWTRKGGRNWGLMAGLCAGAAMAIKYTAFPLLFCAFLVLAVQRRAVLRAKVFREWTAPIAGLLLLLAPWLLKNLAFTGNPFFPYWMDHFSGAKIPEGSYSRLLEEQRVHLTSGLWGSLRLPWALTMANPDAYLFIGPLSLGFFPFLFLFRYKDPSLRFLVWTLPFAFGVGLSITHILKFSIPAFLVLYLVLGAVLVSCRWSWLGRAAAWGTGVAGLLCFTYLANISRAHYDPAAYWMGREDADTYLQAPKRVAPYQDAARWISRNLPPRDQVLVVGGSRGLYIDRPCLNQSVFDEQLLRRLAKSSPDAGSLLRALKREGVDDLLVLVGEGTNVADYGHYDLTKEEWGRLEEVLQRGSDLLYLKDLQGIYRLRKDLGPSHQPRIPDLLLFLSRPAMDFLKAVRAGDRPTAEKGLKEALEEFPYAEEWKAQARAFQALAKHP